jgi:hypothetical protein
VGMINDLLYKTLWATTSTLRGLLFTFLMVKLPQLLEDVP